MNEKDRIDVFKHGPENPFYFYGLLSAILKRNGFTLLKIKIYDELYWMNPCLIAYVTYKDPNGVVYESKCYSATSGTGVDIKKLKSLEISDLFVRKKYPFMEFEIVYVKEKTNIRAIKVDGEPIDYLRISRMH